MNGVRVRFAPSPTGYMHVGNFRTALYTFLFAKKHQGTFILRVEDTDKDRFVEGAIENIIDLLEWAGLQYGEGVFVNSKFQIPNSKQNPTLKITKSQKYENLIEVGNFGPYIQSERLDIYKKYAAELVAKGQAYYCFCTPECLEKMRAEQAEKKQAPMYDRSCLKLAADEIKTRIEAGEKFVIRQKISTEGFTEYDDMVRGKVKIKNDLLDDQILMKSDGYPTYNFANVVDDHLMKISHVLRGEEYISSTPKYIQLYQGFGWEVPEFAHLPLLLNPDKTKLSKRQGDISVEDYIQKGYLREAIINFVALLGWNPGEGSTQEIFSMEELIEKFDLKHVHKAGAIFDLKKLDWLNAQYIKSISTDQLYQLSASPSSLPSPSPSPSFWELHEFFNRASKEKKTEEYLKKVLDIEQDRLTKLSEVGDSNKFFFQNVDYNKELLRWKKMGDEDLKNNLEKSVRVLENIAEADWTRENLEKNLLEAAEENRGELLWPLRAALTGEQKSPSPFEVAWVLGKHESLERLKMALNKL